MAWAPSPIPRGGWYRNDNGPADPAGLDPLTLTLLQWHVEMLNRERAEFGPGYYDSGLLFTWEDGRPVHPDTITSRFRLIVESAGLPKINLHDVRHSYATADRDAKSKRAPEQLLRGPDLLELGSGGGI